MVTEEALQETHNTKKTKPKHRKYTKHMYNYSIAMKLPFVPASPLLPSLLLPTIVGSPVPLTLPNTLKYLLEQRGVASPVCKCTKKVCTYLLTGFSKYT